METINYVENPNYNKPESFEMRMIGAGAGNTGGDLGLVGSTSCGGGAYSDIVSKRANNLQHPEYVVVIGGLETHKSAVFSKRDLVVWRLRVDCFCRGDEEEDEEMGFNYYYGGGNNHGEGDGGDGRITNGGGGGGGFSRERSFEVEF